MAEQMAEALNEAGLGEGGEHEIGTTDTPEDRRSVMERAFSTLESESDDVGVVKPAKEETTVVEGELPGTKPAEKVVKAAPVKQEAAKTAAGKKKLVAFEVDATTGEQKVYKPPGSWKPAAREQWGKVPVEVQEEINRRESETSRALTESTAARKFGQEFNKIVSPFEHLIRGSGVAPLQAVANLMGTAAGLQTGTAIQKASIVRDIIKTYGVDLKTLDSMLAGQEAPKEAAVGAEVQTLLQKELAPVREFISEVRGTRTQQQQQLMQQAAQETETFAADPKHEFYEDLKADMADFLEMAANRGRPMTMQEAYDRAAAQHPDIAKVVNERAAAAAATKTASQMAAKRRAAVSQPGGTPAGMGAAGRGKPKGRQEAINAAWDDLSAASA